jgi:N-methylhydantoinase A
LEEATGRSVALKTPSVPSDPAQAVLNGLAEAVARAGITPAEIGYFVHGTTLGLNTLLERSGAPTGLLVTRGFRDLLEIGRLRLPDPTNYYVEKIKPLVPRWHVREIDERLRADGSEERPVDLAGLEAATRELLAEGVESLALCFLHAYRNPAHEAAALAHLRRVFPDLYVCGSAEIWPQQREYERGLVTVINAYIGRRMRRYFTRLQANMSGAGLTAPLLTTKSNGGVMAAASAADAPVETLLSGPASGVMGALATGQAAGYARLIAFDMGGTSVDVAVIDGEVMQSNESQIGDFPVIMPAVDVSSIGAGGGSIAWLDAAGVLKVGPRSAGAMPGPASYGRGGTAPTVTDAYVRIGVFSPGRVLGGGLVLDHAKAEAAMATIAGPLRLDTLGVAAAILDVATANMYAQFMPLMARKGIDPRDFALLAYGGAGPLHAFLLAKEIGITRVIVPNSPGTLCALGSLMADLRRDVIRTLPGHGPPDAATIATTYAALEAEASAWLRGQAVATIGTRLIRAADMRYRGQSFDLTVAMPEGETGLAPLLGQFHAQYRRIYGVADTKAAVEVTNLRVTALGLTTKPSPAVPDLMAVSHDAVPFARRMVREGAMMAETGFYDRATLSPGCRFHGPAVVEAPDTTIYIPTGFAVQVDAWGNLVGELSA